jgi:hypothetical protein
MPDIIRPSPELLLGNTTIIHVHRGKRPRRRFRLGNGACGIGEGKLYYAKTVLPGGYLRLFRVSRSFLAIAVKNPSLTPVLEKTIRKFPGFS